ncbi:FecR family protein [Brevundimonas aurantiaca]|uniref:FecR family protein n=1 Tax=Brevundimonas aurantiaca TaxID=74316 RepID=UPI00191B64CD|nr:FecR domain-containing protein [Brevundimonas aurantiaca]
MSDPQSATGVADREAAEWHVRLGERPVSADTLHAFKTWRETAGNAEAYHRVERLWRSTGSLSSDGDIQNLTQATLRTSRSGTKRAWPRRFFPAVAVLVPVAAVAAVALALVLWLPSRGLYETEIGGQRVVALDDGTQVRLDTDTRIRVRFASGERRIVLEQGQALFTVAHDAARPFRVEAGGTEVTALGTVFDVRRESTGARVTLVEGSVAVTDVQAETRNWRLAAGQQVHTAGRDPAPVAVDAILETSWTQGHLVFKGTPLREAVAEVNRYLPDKIVLAAGPESEVAVNGTFATGDRDAFVAAVSDLFDLSAQPQADGGVRLTARSVGG